MPPNLKTVFPNNGLRATIQAYADSIVRGTLPLMEKVEAKHAQCGEKPKHRNSCPNVMQDTLNPFIVNCIVDSLESRSGRGTAQMNSQQLAVSSRRGVERLVAQGHMDFKSAQEVASGIHGLATTIIGSNVQALNVATGWLQHYLRKVLTA